MPRLVGRAAELHAALAQPAPLGLPGAVLLVRRGGSPRALCGEAFETQPGALLHSRIAYSAASGAISASISEVSEADAEATSGSAAQPLGGARVSTIEIAAPLLHSRDFATWRDFFAAAAASSRTDGALARPQLCIEYKGAVRDAMSPSHRHAPAPA